jgi:Flp pilus assembly protein TadG
VRLPDRRDAGALTLSYVIVFPAFLLAILAIVQVSLYYTAHNLALAAARQGADVARAYNSTDDAGANAALALISQDGSGMLTSPQAVATRTATTVQVTVTGNAWSVLPVLGLPTAVSETVQEPIERFVP